MKISNFMLNSVGCVLLLAFVACPASSAHTLAASTAPAHGVQLKLCGSFSLPAPAHYDTIWMVDNTLIVTSPATKIAYMCIHKQDIAFIGAHESVYSFISHAMQDPSSAVEKRFLDGFHGTVKTAQSRDGRVRFFTLPQHDSSKVFIVSPDAAAGLEVTIEGADLPYEQLVISKTGAKP